MNLRTFGIGLLTALAALVLLLSPGEAFGKTKNGQAKGQTEEKGKQGPVVQPHAVPEQLLGDRAARRDPVERIGRREALPESVDPIDRPVAPG